MTFKIGIDGRPLQGNPTGVGRYVKELAIELNAVFPNSIFFVYSNLDIELPVNSPNWIKRIDDRFYAKSLKPVLWLKYFCGDLCQKDNLDLFWGTATFLPRLDRKTKIINTIHDLNHIIAPKSLTFSHYLANLIFFEKDLKRADIILTNSYGTANKLKKHFNVSSTITIYPSLSRSFINIHPDQIEPTLRSFGITRPYFLSVATSEPRKNLDLLVKGFLDLKKKGDFKDHLLILVGKSGWKNKILQNLINENKNDIKPLGYVTDEVLANLYQGADAFIFPSVYEGFGIPILEAKACGTPIIATDIPEIREAGGESVVYIEPTYDGIQEGIRKLSALKLQLKTKEMKDRLPDPKLQIEVLTSKILSLLGR